MNSQPQTSTGPNTSSTQLAAPELTFLQKVAPDLDPVLVAQAAWTVAAVEQNWDREGSGPGSRFWGQRREFAQAWSLLRLFQDHQTDASSAREGAGPLVHYEMFATTVDAALTVEGMSDMMRLLRITQAHVRLTKAVR
jgi:hypothetical protein